MGNKKLKYRLGVILAALSFICGVAVYTAPELVGGLMGYLTHSTFQYSINPFNLLNFLIGIAMWFAIGVIAESAYSELGRYVDKK